MPHPRQDLPKTFHVSHVSTVERPLDASATYNVTLRNTSPNQIGRSNVLPLCVSIGIIVRIR